VIGSKLLVQLNGFLEGIAAGCVRHLWPGSISITTLRCYVTDVIAEMKSATVGK